MPEPAPFEVSDPYNRTALVVRESDPEDGATSVAMHWNSDDGNHTTLTIDLSPEQVAQLRDYLFARVGARPDTTTAQNAELIAAAQREHDRLAAFAIRTRPYRWGRVHGVLTTVHTRSCSNLAASKNHGVPRTLSEIVALIAEPLGDRSADRVHWCPKCKPLGRDTGRANGGTIGHPMLARYIELLTAWHEKWLIRQAQSTSTRKV